MSDHEHKPDWRTEGVRVIKGDRLDSNTPQTPGMFRQAAINHARVGAQKIWAGTVAIEPNAKTGVHHHGALESVIYVVSGRARMRWGDKLEYVAEAEPGDFIFVPPYVPHQEINANPDEPLQCVLVRSDNEAVVVSIDSVDPVEAPEEVYWVDPIHKQPD
ncbi:MAG: cupin domain-containing protein [Pseudomonadota bacterium]